MVAKIASIVSKSVAIVSKHVFKLVLIVIEMFQLSFFIASPVLKLLLKVSTVSFNHSYSFRLVNRYFSKLFGCFF
jgi:hypothetical protein